VLAGRPDLGKKLTLDIGSRSNGLVQTEFRAALQGHSRYISTFAFSANGRTLVTVCCDETARLWDVESGQCKATLSGSVGTLAMSTDLLAERRLVLLPIAWHRYSFPGPREKGNEWSRFRVH
jgi:WD40 repeat protein